MKPYTPQQALDEFARIREINGVDGSIEEIHSICTLFIKKGIEGDLSHPLNLRININSDTDPVVSNAVALVQILQKGFTDEQRLELWQKIAHGYCQRCGGQAEPRIDGCFICFCDRDE